MGLPGKLSVAAVGGKSEVSHLSVCWGRAIDVRLADVDSAVLRDAAIELRRGGVGYYRGPDFAHMDTGRVRRW